MNTTQIPSKRTTCEPNNDLRERENMPTSLSVRQNPPAGVPMLIFMVRCVYKAARTAAVIIATAAKAVPETLETAPEVREAGAED